MALPRLRATPHDDPTEIEVPRLVDDLRYAEASRLLSAFTDFMARLERERDRLILRRHFADTTRGDATSDRDLRTRLTKLEAEAPLVAMPPNAAADGAPAAVLLGLAVLNGESIESPPDHASQMREIERKLITVRAAIFAQKEIVDGIAEELTFEYAKRLKPAWDALQLQLYRDGQALARTTRRVRELRAAITAAGIRSRSDVLAMPNVRAPLILGDESVWDSEISTWRRILEQLGILG